MRPTADSPKGLGPSPGADRSQGLMNAGLHLQAARVSAAVITLLHITSSFLTA